MQFKKRLTMHTIKKQTDTYSVTLHYLPVDKKGPGRRRIQGKERGGGNHIPALVALTRPEKSSVEHLLRKWVASGRILWIATPSSLRPALGDRIRLRNRVEMQTRGWRPPHCAGALDAGDQRLPACSFNSALGDIARHNSPFTNCATVLLSRSVSLCP